jgi:DNA-binding CsgD family transcriptional regulator
VGVSALETNGNGSVAEAESALDEVRAALARPRGQRVRNAAALAQQVQTLNERLRAGLLVDRDVASLATNLELVYELTELGSELRARDLFERLAVLDQIQESMEVLHACESPEALISSAPRELCRACGFSRAMISRIRGSHWVPVVYEAVPGMDPEEDLFRSWVEQVEIPLEHMLLETELVRRRMPALVRDPEQDPRTFKDIVTRGRTSAYVAAPIIPAGRAIGFLHADRLGQEEQATAEDRDSIWTFAEQFGFLYHRAVLVERLAAQRAQLHDAFIETEQRFEDLRTAEIELGQSAASAPEYSAAALFMRTESRIDALMTRREREVLELITSGATNMRIAEQLVISEGTVKSHVKHILRKLRVSNRAEAVARYLQLLLRDQEQAGG